MDAIQDQTLAGLLADACAAASASDGGIVGVASALASAAQTENDPSRALAAGLEYRLRLDDESREAYGPYGPMIEVDGTVYPAPLDRIGEIEPGIFSLWSRAIEHAPVALVRARFADLLWVARFGDRPHQYAQLAIDSYVAAADADFGHPVEVSDAVQRAVELATAIKDTSRRSGAVRTAVKLVEASIASENRRPGVALRLLDMFVRDQPERRPPEIDELLERAQGRFGDDPWNLESIFAMRAQLAPPSDRPAIIGQVVEAFRDHARSSRGLTRYSHLQHALDLAEQHDLGELAEDTRREIEAMPEDDLDLHTVSTDVTIPRAEIEAFVDQFVGDDDLESALTRFAAHVPTGDPDANRKAVEQQMAHHPLLFTVTKLRIGTENSLISSTVDADDHAKQALIEHEAFSASMHSLFAVDVLAAVRRRYGTLSVATEWFETELVEGIVARRICHAIKLYEDGDYDTCASTLVPRLERIIRRIARSVGLTVTRSPDRQGRPGGVKGLVGTDINTRT